MSRQQPAFGRRLSAVSDRLAAVSLALFVVALAGCRSAPQITGTYELVGANGKRLPVPAGQGQSELIGGSLSLNPDGTYSYRLLLHIKQPGQDFADSTVKGGTYTHRMNMVTLEAPGGNTTAQIAGSALSVKLGTWTYLFRKAEP